ncbi:TetR/AcrR family transcriptional regulator [Pedobacter sp.]
MIEKRTAKSKKKAEIIKEGLALFLQKGYSNVLIDEIAMRSGVTKKTLYNHFDSKKVLFSECMNTFIEDFEKGAHEILSCKHSVLMDKIEAYLDFIGRKLNGASTIFWKNLKDEVPDIWSEMVNKRQKMLLGHLSQMTRLAVVSNEIKDDGLAEMAIVMYISAMEKMNDAEYMSRFPVEIQRSLPSDISERASKALTLVFDGLVV